jgi:hypothetical protein
VHKASAPLLTSIYAPAISGNISKHSERHERSNAVHYADHDFGEEGGEEEASTYQSYGHACYVVKEALTKARAKL